jgi:thioredoxin:protein disulfide reductase
MKTILAAIAILLFLFVHAFARSPDSVVTIRAIAPVETLKAGQATVIGVEFAIAKPYHINSDRPLEDYLIPTILELEPLAGVTFGKVTFPPAPPKKLPVSDSPMSVYEGTVRISIEITPDASLALKDIILKGKVRYQACDDRACLPPVRKPFSLALSFQSAAISSAPQSLPAAASEGFGDRGIFVTLLLVFLGGLALNLTPCVYPMIPITISYFGGQSQGKKGSLVAHACLYVIGMAVTYSILGVFAAMTGSLFGAALRYPPVLIFIAVVMILLALSMFDVYEFRMPAFLNRVAGGSQKGLAGTFLMGLTVGIVAAPCIGPFVLGLLTYVGNKGNIFLGFLLFFVLALGMGVPFVVLAIFSGNIKKLPRSGAWMIWVRKVFGFILLAMAVYFLEPLFPNALAYRLTFGLIALLAGIYLGWVDRVENTGKVFPLVRNAVGVLFFALALYAAVTGIENYLRHLPAGSGGPASQTAIQWLPYSQTMLDQAAREGKPVFIDFYADWCVPCKEMDVQTFTVPEIVSRSKGFVMLKVDLTSTEDPKAEALRGEYRVKGVPTFVFLKADGREIPDLRGTGFESKDVFLKKMNKALESSRKQSRS